MTAASLAPALTGCILALAAAGLSAGLIVALRPLLLRYALARPNARSLHRQPTPQGGGIAVLAGAVAAALGAFVAAVAGLVPWATAGSGLGLVLAASLVIALVGLVDDLPLSDVTNFATLET